MLARPRPWRYKKKGGQMKAYKLNLKDYRAERTKLVKDTTIGETEKVEEDYNIKEVIANIMCHPTQKHKGIRFHTVAQIAMKIEKYKNDTITLDKADYEIVKKCFDDFVGYARNDGEMVARIYDAEEVELETKEKKKKND